MTKTLIIAEKPSVARDIASVLKCGKKGDGFLFSDEYIVSWAIGHLVTLCEPDDYNPSLKKWDMATLPIIPKQMKLKGIYGTKKQLEILKKLMNSEEVSEIICATDSGREGELIFRYIYDIVKCSKPFKRLWISSMTEQAISDGFRNLRESSAYDNLYLSAKCRSEADWLVGINATRAFTVKYGTLLSIGRVQTPTLALIVNRQKEIDEFVPVDYYEVVADFGNYKGIWFNKKPSNTKIMEIEKAENIKNSVTNKNSVVESTVKKNKKVPPYFLYDLTELQRDANKYFGFSASKTLEIAQSLYEKRKAITYPRTDSRFLSSDLIPKLPKLLERILLHKEVAEEILAKGKLKISKRIVDDSKVSDHHALIPTDKKISPSSFTPDEFKIYELIVRRFVSVFMDNYSYNATEVITVVEHEKFISKGIEVIELGFMKLYKKQIDLNKDSESNSEDTETSLPKLSEGDMATVINAEVNSKKTAPPKPYTEATLLTAMENAGRFVEDESLKESLKASGLGTPATRAAIFERLIQIKYIFRKGKSLLPTEKGINLIKIVPEELKTPSTTGKWEKGLNTIALGNMESTKFMSSIERYVNYIIKYTMNSKAVTVFENEPSKKNAKTKSHSKSLGICPKCKKNEVLENSKAYYCSGWKSGCKFTVWKNSLETYSITLDAKIIETILKDEVYSHITFYLPQTKEKCIGDLKFREGNNGEIEILNLTRVK